MVRSRLVDRGPLQRHAAVGMDQGLHDAGDISSPCEAPAAREIVSFISVSPRSLTPALSIRLTPSAPSLTQEAWILVMCRCRMTLPPEMPSI